MSEFVEALEKLKALKESGVLTEDEFADQKAKILARTQPSAKPANLHDAMDERTGGRPSKVAPFGGVIGCLIYAILMIVLLPLPLLTLAFFNWDPIEVNIWSNLVLETKTGLLMIFFAIAGYLLGLIPALLLSLSRRR